MDNFGFRLVASGSGAIIRSRLHRCVGSSPERSCEQRRAALNYFSQPKIPREPAKEAAAEPKLVGVAAKAAPEIVSTFGSGMLITGNIVCPGALQIFGRVTGDIHASHLIVCEGAKVEGKIVAQETVIQGIFTGTVHSNNVKLQGSAKVDGEIFNKSLAIEPNVQFEGVSRRLERPVENPKAGQAAAARPEAAAPAPRLVEPVA
jgi:cytoskeletal protein CcmA (bactofilin family)